MKKYQKGFIILPILLILAIIGSVGFIVFKNFNKKQPIPQPVANSNTATNDKIATVVPTKEILKDAGSDIKWVTHTNKERGISFDYPEGSDIVYALGNDTTEVDVKPSDKASLVTIGIYMDKKIVDNTAIANAIAEKEKEFKTNERYIKSEMKKSLENNSGNYTVTGEEYYLSFSDENVAKDLQDMAVTTYKFQERGYFKVGSKTITLHGMTLSKSPQEDVITRIIESFKLINN